jgi:hypothetical protein
MGQSKKIGEWSGNTDTHSLDVRFFEDEEQGLITAMMEAKVLSPPLSSLRRPKQPPRRIETPEIDRLEDTDLDILIARCRAHITARYGQIRNLRQKML